MYYAMPDHHLPSGGKSPRNRAMTRPPKAWGVGRVAFLARVDTIRAELAQGWSLTSVYARHKDALGIGYQAFWRLVVRHAADARPAPGRTVHEGANPCRQASAREASSGTRTTSAMPLKTPPSVEGSDAHARHQPRRTFNHDPVERPGDYERLFGIRKP